MSIKKLTYMTSYFLTQRDYVLPIDIVHESREGYGHVLNQSVGHNMLDAK